MRITIAAPEGEPSETQLAVRTALFDDLRARGFHVVEADLSRFYADSTVVRDSNALAADITHEGSQAEGVLIGATHDIARKILFYSVQTPNGSTGAVPNRASQLMKQYLNHPEISMHCASNDLVARQMSRLWALTLTRYSDVQADTWMSSDRRDVAALPPEDGPIPDRQLFHFG